MLHYRNYRSDEPVEVGDVVSMNGDAETGLCFASCIVTGVEGDYVHLDRVHMHASAVRAPGCPSTTWTAVESYSVLQGAFKTSHVVHVTGKSGLKDNRVR